MDDDDEVGLADSSSEGGSVSAMYQKSRYCVRAVRGRNCVQMGSVT